MHTRKVADRSALRLPRCVLAVMRRGLFVPVFVRSIPEQRLPGALVSGLLYVSRGEGGVKIEKQREATRAETVSGDGIFEVHAFRDSLGPIVSGGQGFLEAGVTNALACGGTPILRTGFTKHTQDTCLSVRYLRLVYLCTFKTEICTIWDNI